MKIRLEVKLQKQQKMKQLKINENGEGDLAGKIRSISEKYGISSNDIKNLTITAALIKLQQAASASGNNEDTGFINSLFGIANQLGIANQKFR